MFENQTQNKMKQINYFSLAIFLSAYSYNIEAQQSYNGVGIKTKNTTQELDVNGNVRIRGLANPHNMPIQISALQDGTLVTSISAQATPGIRFVGVLGQDVIILDNQFDNIDILDSLELMDFLDEYSGGRYVPRVSGFYNITIGFDVGDYLSTTEDLDILIGFWEYHNRPTTSVGDENIFGGEWVARRVVNHRNNNNSDISDFAINTSYDNSTYVNLTAGRSYGFRVFGQYNTDIRGATLKATNRETEGLSANPPVTSFSIEKVL